MPIAPRIIILLVLACAASMPAQESPPAKSDSLRTNSGESIQGKFLKLEGGAVHFQTTDIGTVQVRVARIQELVLAEPRKARVRLSVDIRHQEEVTLSTRNGLLVLRDNASERELRLNQLKGIDEVVPAGDATWNIGGRAFVSYVEGNVKNVTLGFRFDIRRNTLFNEIKLFAEGNFLQDRLLKEDQVRRRDFAAGFLYRYNAPFRLTADLTQDYFSNELAAMHYRSITGTGLSYFPAREPDYSWSLSAAATYTIEDLSKKAEDRRFMGARCRTELDTWAENRIIHFRLMAEVLFDFEEMKNITATYEALLEIKFLGFFTLGISFRDQFDNLPVAGRFHHDVTVGAVLGIAWGGKGP